MCRNIRILFDFDPPVTEEEIRAESLQYVRKIRGFNKPSKANEAAFARAVEEVAAASSRLLTELETNAPKRNREKDGDKGPGAEGGAVWVTRGGGTGGTGGPTPRPLDSISQEIHVTSQKP
jgi:hypothetical protein